MDEPEYECILHHDGSVARYYAHGKEETMNKFSGHDKSKAPKEKKAAKAAPKKADPAPAVKAKGKGKGKGNGGGCAV